MIDKLIEHINKPEVETKNKAPEGLCPVCWGIQEYDGKVRVLVKDRQIEINNQQKKDMRLKAFVKEHIEGIRLQEGEVLTCPNCSERMKRTE
ncbi:hypothetical protein G9Q97_06690 [Cyclobacterium sp. GBPx2]|uniref:HNH endonuclease n=1 Tax=Cyclobacterium plantarum TaxID=2716263 RepID=A0ABX0H8H1_9BACT|nr:hypothetical protein [Cyclobacterium plantarum]